VDLWQDAVDMVMELCVSWKAENFLNSSPAMSISKSILLEVGCNHPCVYDSHTGGIPHYR
jgi:hypothetical protein